MVDPVAFIWDGEVMRPKAPKAADRRFVIREDVYWLEEVDDRSGKSHNHEFVWLTEAWKNMPERLSDSYPTPEHLRKRALIDTGYFRETLIDAGSQAAALRVAAFARECDEFALVITRGPAVIVRVAKSQKMRGADRMDRQTFQESKDAILGWVSELTGIPVESLIRNAGQAA